MYKQLSTDSMEWNKKTKSFTIETIGCGCCGSDAIYIDPEEIKQKIQECIEEYQEAIQWLEKVKVQLGDDSV